MNTATLPRCSDTAGEIDGKALTAIQRTRDRHLLLRDRAVIALRTCPDDLSGADLARRMGVPAKLLGRVLNRFPRYFVCRGDDGRHGVLITSVRLHPHLTPSTVDGANP